jgi:toxin ParE1/3/4
VSGTRYIVAYRVAGEVVTILRVLHGAQQWPKQFPQSGRSPLTK